MLKLNLTGFSDLSGWTQTRKVWNEVEILTGFIRLDFQIIKRNFNL